MAKITFRSDNGSIHVRINGSRIMANITKAQMYLDNAVLRDSNLYVPHRQGELRRSGIRNTVLGSGEIRWVTPYAHYQYVGKDMVGIKSKKHWARKNEPKEYNGRYLQYHAKNTGSRWFKTAKRIHGEEWVNKVKKIAGGD